MRDHELGRLCRQCFKAVTPPKQKAKKEAPLALNPAIDMGALVPSFQDLVTSISSFLASPVRVELAPLVVQLTGALMEDDRARSRAAAESNISPQVPRKDHDQTAEQIPTAIPIAAMSIDTALLGLMGSRKKKWRPKELLAELVLHQPTLRCTETDITASLERLSRATGLIPDVERVVKLPTRYMRRDFFVEADEMEFIDVLILLILEKVGPRGLPATAVHEAIGLCTSNSISLPSVLNHLRVLKTPAWSLVAKAGRALRENYTISDKGVGILKDIRTELGKGPAAPRDWRARFVSWGIVNEAGEKTPRVAFLEKPLQAAIVAAASPADKQLLLAMLDKRFDDATRQSSRKIALLEALGF
jgi:hypothetical protein